MWQKPCVVVIVAASKLARASASRCRRRATTSGPPSAIIAEHQVVGGRLAHRRRGSRPRPRFGRYQPFSHPVSQLARGHPGEGDGQDLGQRDHALGHQPGHQRRDGEGLAGARAGLEDGYPRPLAAGRKRRNARPPVASGQCSLVRSWRSTGPHSLIARRPNRRGFRSSPNQRPFRPSPVSSAPVPSALGRELLERDGAPEDGEVLGFGILPGNSSELEAHCARAASYGLSSWRRAAAHAADVAQ